jgi:hypothetical protein
MLPITKDESAFLRSAIPGLHIAQTVHKRYVEESRAVKKLLNEYRSKDVVETYPEPKIKTKGGNRKYGG